MKLTPEEMQQIQDDVREIKRALLGTPELKEPGLVDLVHANKGYIERDQKWKAKAVGALAVLQMFATTIAGWFLAKH